MAAQEDYMWNEMSRLRPFGSDQNKIKVKLQVGSLPFLFHVKVIFDPFWI